MVLKSGGTSASDNMHMLEIMEMYYKIMIKKVPTIQFNKNSQLVIPVYFEIYYKNPTCIHKKTYAYAISYKSKTTSKYLLLFEINICQTNLI